MKVEHFSRQTILLYKTMKKNQSITYLNRIYPLNTKAIVLFLLFFLILTISSGKLSLYPVILNAPYDILIGLFAGIFTFYLSITISRVIKIIGRTKIDSNNRSIIKNLLMSDNRVISILFTTTFIAFFSLAEEIIFRSIILSYLIQYFGVFISVLLSSLLYSLIHFNVKYIQLFLMGIVYSFIVLYTNNLFPAILAHFINNMMILIFFTSHNIKQSSEINE